MADMISREALVDKSEILYQHTASGKIIPWSAVRVCAINNTPVVDAVEVVRCKDCRSYLEEEDGWCLEMDRSINPTDFCSYGEKREA